MKTTTAPLKCSVQRSPLRFALLVIPFSLACFALSWEARGTCQDACLTNNNTVQGDDALISLTTGTDNTAIGFNALYTNFVGSYNTGIGAFALDHNGNGDNNTATGYNSLFYNTTGSANTATGSFALYNSMFGDDNTANGSNALYSNFSGFSNTAIGSDALYFNNTGFFNTAIGNSALYYNGNGVGNSASGYQALYSNTVGGSNTASGFQALYSNTRGHDNTALGHNALFSNTFGSKNIAVGADAGTNLTNGSHNIDIGNTGVAGEAKTIRVGNEGTQTATYIAGINGATVPTGIPVIVDSNGHLGITTSSARFKEEIKPLDEQSEAILSLRPVSFRYKKELDPSGNAQFGLVAEEVAKVAPELVERDKEGKPLTVRYDEVNAMLLNEFLKEHRTVQELKSDAAKQETIIAHLQQQIDSLTATVQKVSAQLELGKAAPQTALSNH
jgi:hypothetical protein